MNKLLVLITFIILSGSGCKKEQLNVNESNTTGDTKRIFASLDSLSYTYKIVILMYHKIVTNPSEDIYERSATKFENDMNYVISKGYQILNFDDLAHIKAGTKKLTSNAVIISFDDGQSSDYYLASPVLKELEIPATFFVVTEWVGDSDRLCWSKIWELDQYRSAKGKKLFSIESHTSSHPFLVSNSANFSSDSAYLASLDAELGDSKDWIQSVTGQTNMWLALPYGDGANDAKVIATAKKHGYSGIRTSLYGSFTLKTMDLFCLPSLPILSTTDITDVELYMN